MFKIERDALYTRQDLAAMLEPAGVDVDHFIGRLRPVKRFKMLYFGFDLLAALETCQPLAEREDAPALPAPANRGNRKRRGAAGGPLDGLRRLMRE